MFSVHHVSKSYGIQPILLAVVHDRYCIEHFASEVWNLKDGKLKY